MKWIATGHLWSVDGISGRKLQWTSMVVHVPTNLFSPRCSAARVELPTADAIHRFSRETLHGVADIRFAATYPNLRHNCRRRLWVPVIHVDAKRSGSRVVVLASVLPSTEATDRSNGLDKNILGRNWCPPSHVRLGNMTAENHLNGVPSNSFGFLPLMAIYHYICQAGWTFLYYNPHLDGSTSSITASTFVLPDTLLRPPFQSLSSRKFQCQNSNWRTWSLFDNTYTIFCKCLNFQKWGWFLFANWM